MRKFALTAIILGFTNVFTTMTQQQNSPTSLYNSNSGVETFATYEVGGVNHCYNGGRRAISCPISDGIDIKDGGVSASCDVPCQTGYYACYSTRCTRERY